jgi:hypothetical protein
MKKTLINWLSLYNTNNKENQNMALKIKASSEEILKGKFSNTLTCIQGYVTEAKGDIGMDVNYGPKAVLGRMKLIQETFIKDMENLAKDLIED